MKIIFYIFVFFFFIKILIIEFMDIFHPKGLDGKNRKECFDGGGKLIFPFKYKKNDNIRKIINKTIKLSKYHGRTVKWRRFVLISIIVIIAGQYCAYGKIPDINKSLTLFAVMFTVIMGCESFYQYHYHDWASLYVKNNLSKVKKLLKVS